MDIYTDGSCLGNPGRGGAAYVVVGEDGREVNSWSKGFELTTNNRMELYACIQALSDHGGESVRIVTDSQYVKNGITGWIHKWKKNGWQTAAKRPVKNADLWSKLDTLSAGESVAWDWTRAHTGDEHNERADTLAREAAEDGPHTESDTI